MDSRQPDTTSALIGASNAHSVTPLDVTELPRLHCMMNGANRNRLNCTKRNGSKRLVLK